MVVNCATRWLGAILIKEASAETCARTLVNQLTAKFRVPAHITSDGGAQFTSALWTQMAKLVGVKLHHTMAYHPQSNGLVEWFHRHLKASLMARLSRPDWADELPWVFLGIRMAPKEDLQVRCTAFPTDSTTIEAPDVKTIWAEDDVPEGSEFEDIWDTRQQPEYEVLFKQRVGTEDVFLGMSRKDGSTACCEDMVIRVKLPDCKPADLTLDVKEHFLGLRSSVYKLGLHLPHPVDSKNGRAQFHSETHTLEITLTMKREFDFINFA
ncbi:dynein axonemal assembly factor 6 isoform X1 [Narcine bancroftii]|uniref:dynein axonemal assembly factor 6 isoform X1 n=1 Tax=Narcine bancroftii TaxID=1343680 RepID=UPI003831B62B